MSYGSKAILSNLALIGASTFLALGAVEVALRIIQPSPPKMTHPQVEYIFVPCDPVTGRSGFHYMKPNQDAYHLDVPVSSNSLGIRNDEVSEEKHPSRRRILAIGDSHTFGYGVPERDSWPRLLNSKLVESGFADYEVVNGGIGALSLAQELELFKQRLMGVQPDHVVIAYYWNDMPIEGSPDGPISDESVAQLGRCRSTTSAEARGTGSVAIHSAALGWIKSALRRSYLIYFVVQRVPQLQMRFFPTSETEWKRRILTGESSARLEASWGVVAEKLAEWKNLGDEMGFQLELVVVPLFEQMATQDQPNTDYQDRVRKIASELDIQVIDPLLAIRQIAPTYPADFIPFDGHPTKRIYEVMANEIFEFYERE